MKYASSLHLFLIDKFYDTLFLDSSEKCAIGKGKAAGTYERKMDIPTNNHQECLKQVKEFYPNANGMTWYAKSNNCFAVFDAYQLESNQCTDCISCIFDGNIEYL